jgi:hypothetical protein
MAHATHRLRDPVERKARSINNGSQERAKFGSECRGGQTMTREPSRPIAEPEPGYFRMRLVKGGPWVAARIWIPFGILMGEINGGEADPHRIWESAERISVAAWLALMRDPPANPDQPIDLAAMPPPF